MTPPVIETERLILRGPARADFEPLCAYFADPRSRFNGGPRTEAETWSLLLGFAGQWTIRGHGLWFLIARETGAFVGFAGLFHPRDWPEPELGWGVTAAHEGRGLAHEAVAAARMAAAERLGITAPPSYIAPDNARSIALARRLGAVQEDDIILRESRAHVFRHPAAETPRAASAGGSC